MRRIDVKLGANSYEVYVGAGLLARTGQWLKEKRLSRKLVIITDPTVDRLYTETLKRNLARDGFSVNLLLVSEGEGQKSLETAGRLYQKLTDCHAERMTPILALGGGVIGDLTGFVAATYLRGVPFIQIPTTLLAQVDSSTGGKVAVDHGKLKNKIGMFYQPKLVIADTDTLNTLPASQLTNGLAEVIKSAAILDKKFFDYIAANIDRIKTLEDEALEEVVYRSIRIKADVVEKDEKDLGLRSILNYGHTIGHALESVSNFGLDHGKAVAIGMIAAARISNKLGFLDRNEVIRLKRVIETAGLPTQVPKLDTEEIMEAIRHDKKVKQGKVRFALLKAIGEVFITDEVIPSTIREVLINEKT